MHCSYFVNNYYTSTGIWGFAIYYIIVGISVMMAINSSITEYNIKITVEKLWSIPLELDDTFPKEIALWLRINSRKLGVPFTYLAYPLLTSASYMLVKSEVKVSETYREPIILYCLVSGRSGTNKSGAAFQQYDIC